MSLVYLLSTLDNVKNITIRCPNKLLLDQDKYALEEIKAAVRGVTKIYYRIGNMHLGAKEETIEIVDECDALILDDP